MRPYGSDRMTLEVNGHILLVSRTAKGWRERTARTATSVELAGTAVLWDAQFFEVLAVEPLPDGCIQYELAEWPENHLMRSIEKYDAQSDIALRRRAALTAGRETKRRLAIVLTFFTGLLPAAVQEHLQSELGLRAALLTLGSTLPPLAFCILWIHWIVRARLAGPPPPLPGWTLTFAIYAGISSLVRIVIAVNQGRPVGSPLGLIGYSLWYALTSHRGVAIAPLASPKGISVRFTQPSDEIAIRDSIRVREPLLTLLSREEQQLIMSRFGLDLVSIGRITARVILVFAALGAVTSVAAISNRGVSLSNVSSLMAAVYLVVEQIKRLRALESGPMGSVMGIAARPLVRKIIAAASQEPTQ
jgi:hypothetical protein